MKKYPCPYCRAQNLTQSMSKCDNTCDNMEEISDDFVFGEHESDSYELLNLDEQ